MNKFVILATFLGLSFTGLAFGSPTTIYIAKKIITMDPSQTEATAVAVKDNKIYSVGSLDQMKTWLKPGSYSVDTRFAQDIITPGFIEAHCHWTLLLGFLGHTYLGYYDFLGFNAKILPGLKSKQAVLDRLKAADKELKDPNQVLIGWNYDPIFFNNSDLTAKELDQISTTRPIFVLNASEHIAYVNSNLLQKAHLNSNSNIVGLEKNKDGTPNGVLKEIAAMTPVLPFVLNQVLSPSTVKNGLVGAGELAHRVGLTTVSDLFFGGADEALLLDQFKKSANDPNYPVRMVLVYNGPLLSLLEKKSPGSGVAYLNNLIQQSSNKLQFGGVKFVSDGSIQGFTALLNWPGYFNGAPNGIANISLDDLKNDALPFWKAGFAIHVHANGNQATDNVLNALNYLQTSAPRKDAIFVIEHDQMSSQEQFERAKRLGASVNLFSNQIYYWGDIHYNITLGPDRAEQLDNAALAQKMGLMYSLHSDSPVTPLGPLHVMWAAVNRVTASGKVLGASAKITAEEALRAVTLNAAYLLGLQNKIGSIEVGKNADFTILGQDPLSVEPMKIKDIPVIATVQNGVVLPIEK